MPAKRAATALAAASCVILATVAPRTSAFQPPSPRRRHGPRKGPMGGWPRGDHAALARGGALSPRSPTGLDGAGGSAAAEASTPSEGGDDAVGLTLGAAIFNLIKGCVGSGVLSLPAGVAALGDVTGALVPATALVLLCGAVSAYSFHLLGRLTAVANAEDGDGSAAVTSIGQIWDREMGPSSSWLVTLAVLLTCLGSLLSYSILLGDIFSSLAQTAGLTGVLASRRFNVAAIAALGIYPICTLRDLAALAPVSMSGVVGIFVTCVVMTLRAMPGGPYSPTGKYFGSVPVELRPSFGGTGMKSPSNMLVLSSMTATAYLVHMSGPDFYQNLKSTSVREFTKLSAVGFGATALISAFMMGIGFLAFGGATQGNVLNNYSALDGGATLCRLLLGVSLLGSYGFLGNACKKAYYQLRHKGKEVTDRLHYNTSRAMVAGLTCLALLIKDAGFVVSLTGAVLGSALIYMIPPFLWLRSTKRRMDGGLLESSKSLRLERLANKGLIGVGVILGLLGAYMSVLNSFFPHLL